MNKTTIALGDNAELIIDDTEGAHESDQALILTHAVSHAFANSTRLYPGSLRSSLPIQVGARLASVYYEFRIKRVLDALAAYSGAIQHIESNMDRYDRRLARKAIDVLRDCYRRHLR